MNKRERILASAVAVLVAVVGSMYLVNGLSSSFEQRQRAKEDLERKLMAQDRMIRLGKVARREMEQLYDSSLPSDHLLARSDYANWLLDLAKIDIGLTDVSVRPQQRSQAHRDLFVTHTFTVSGEGDLQQLTRFLYEFYSVSYLHRMSKLNAQPQPDSNQLKLNMTIEAVSLNGAPAERYLDDPPYEPPRLAYGGPDEYVKTIVERNFFSPANHPPQLRARRDPVRGNVGGNVTFTVAGSDPDGDPLAFELVGEVPRGAGINRGSGEFSWKPAREGEFDVEIRVTDNGLPPRSDSAKIKILVAAAAADESPFDPATQAYVTGFTQNGSETHVWINVKTDGRELRLREGDTLDVGSVQGTIERIHASGADIRTADGRTLVALFGKPLVSE